MPSRPDIVPMPLWSTLVACIKLILTILILSFVSACIAILGGIPAFGITIFAATTCLLTFGYYLVALSFSPALYNKWVVLSLEAFQMLLWFISAAMLGGWVVDSRHVMPDKARPNSISGGAIPLDSAIPTSVVRRSFRHVIAPIELRYDVAPVSINGGGYGKDRAAIVLGGIATGFASVICVLYVLTLYIYARNLTRQALEPPTLSPSPEPTPYVSNVISPQAHSVPFMNRPLPPLPLRQQALSSPSISSFPSTPEPQNTAFDPVALSRPPPVDTSHQDGMLPQSRAQYYLNPHSAAEAGIAPPTPVQRALDAGTHISQTPVHEQQREYDPVSPLTPAVDARIMSLPEITPNRPISFDAATHHFRS